MKTDCIQAEAKKKMPHSLSPILSHICITLVQDVHEKTSMMSRREHDNDNAAI